MESQTRFADHTDGCAQVAVTRAASDACVARASGDVATYVTYACAEAGASGLVSQSLWGASQKSASASATACADWCVARASGGVSDDDDDDDRRT